MCLCNSWGHASIWTKFVQQIYFSWAVKAIQAGSHSAWPAPRLGITPPITLLYATFTSSQMKGLKAACQQHWQRRDQHSWCPTAFWWLGPGEDLDGGCWAARAVAGSCRQGRSPTGHHALSSKGTLGRRWLPISMGNKERRSVTHQRNCSPEKAGSPGRQSHSPPMGQWLGITGKHGFPNGKNN